MQDIVNKRGDCKGGHFFFFAYPHLNETYRVQIDQNVLDKLARDLQTA